MIKLVAADFKKIIILCFYRYPQFFSYRVAIDLVSLDVWLKDYYIPNSIKIGFIGHTEQTTDDKGQNGHH